MDEGSLSPPIIFEGERGLSQPKERHEELSQLIYIYLIYFSFGL